jgi:drug/metabolite transporter (DMT)-like permease
MARRATFVLGVVTIAWGTTFVLTQNLVAEMPVSSFLFWRFAIAAVTLAVLRPRAVTRLSPRDRRHALVAGSALAAAFTLQSVGLQHTSATTSGFITGMFVVLTPLVSAALFRDRIPARVWWGVGLAVGGLGVLSLRGWAVGPGDALTLLGALAFAVQIALLAQWTTPSNAFGIATVEMAVVAVVGLGLTVLDGGPQMPTSAETWAALAFLVAGR